MKVKVHSIHFDADEKLLAFIDRKVGKLENYFDRIITSEVYLRIDKSSDAINKVAEIRMNIPGKELFAKKQCKSFEEATDTAIDALRRQLKRYKEKHLKV
jgi:putative sigma-54 modulation protein